VNTKLELKNKLQDANPIYSLFKEILLMKGFHRHVLAVSLVLFCGAQNFAAAADQEGRRWQIANPGQNNSSVSFEVRGLGPSDEDWNNETPLNSGRLTPGQQLVLNCDGWGALDIKWHLNTSDYNPDTDLFSVRLPCIEENFFWNSAHNLREYDFPRQ
jgi:hypothetical protein